MSPVCFSSAARRQKELAIRLSIGAGRFRIVRQLLTEALVIGLCLFRHRARACQPEFNEFTNALPVNLDRNVLLYAAGISIASALLSALCSSAASSRSTTRNSDSQPITCSPQA